MATNDDRLGEELREAAGRDLPGGEFDRRVMQSIEGGGGERVLSVDAGGSRWRGLSLAAAAEGREGEAGPWSRELARWAAVGLLLAITRLIGPADG